MPVTLGAAPQPGFDNPIALLSDCHRRIEGFLAVLIRVAERCGGGELDEEARRAWETALRYFRDAAPKHTQDEEESLFPRMRGSRDPEAIAALEAVARLEADHGVAEAAHRQVDDLGRRWLDTGRLSGAEASRLASLLGELRRLYQQHIAVEDGSVFPLAARLLSAEQVRAIGREMASRRGGVPFPE